jgi:hypothetical protein
VSGVQRAGIGGPCTRISGYGGTRDSFGGGRGTLWEGRGTRWEGRGGGLVEDFGYWGVGEAVGFGYGFAGHEAGVGVQA